MPGSGWEGAFQGLNAGLDAGYGFMDRRRAMMERQQIEQAQRALAQGQINASGGQPGPQGPPPGGMPPPGAQPPPQIAPQPPGGPQGPGPGMGSAPPPPQMPMPGAQPMPGQGPPGGSFAGPGPGGPMAHGIQQGMQPGAPVGGGAPPPGALSASSPGTPPPSPASAGGGGLSGVAAPSGDSFVDAQKTVGNVFQELIKQNPQLKQNPMLLFKAAEQQIGLMKGVNNDVRNMMQMQLGTAKLEYNYNSLNDRHNKWSSTLTTQLQMLDAKLADKKLDRANRITLQNLRDSTAEMIASERVGAMERGQDMNLEGRREGIEGQDSRAEAQIDAANSRATDAQNVAGYKAQAGSSGTEKAPPKIKPKAPTRIERPTRGAATPAPAAKGSYKSLADLTAAHKAGKVSTADARKIAVQNGWAQ